MLDIKKCEKLVEKIKQYDNIIIAKHKLPDWDAQGSAMGLAYIIEKNFENKKIFVVGERLNDDLDFLSNEISDEFVQNSLLITVDTAVKSRIDFDRVELVKEVFKVDHHINVEDYADNDLILDSSIANTEVITLWAMKMNLIIPKQAGHNLYLGLLTDSGRFLYEKTDAQTFIVASKLLEFGADFKKANDYLYVSSLKMRKWMNFAFSKVNITNTGIAYIVLTKDDQKGWDLNYEEIKSCLSTMAGIEEIKIWFTVIEYEDQLKVSFRSRDYEVNKIAEKHNGGGHKLASGARIESLDEIPVLVYELENLIKMGGRIMNDINETEMSCSNNKLGWIELITGCMFAGKTEEFIRRLKIMSYAKKKVVVFKSGIDQRYSKQCVASHSGTMLESNIVQKSDDIRKIVEQENLIKKVEVVGIDEVQFLDEGVVDLIDELADQGIIVIVNGLDKDFRCEPFKNVDKLLAIAEFVTKLRARCHICGNFANRSQRIVNGEPAKWDSPLILVDGKESYEARCRTCYVLPKKGA